MGPIVAQIRIKLSYDNDVVTRLSLHGPTLTGALEWFKLLD
jgi:hypothetical protein